jgi:hypothetical protein
MDKISDSRGDPFSFFPGLTAGLFGISLVIIATRWGVGTSPDSAAYLGTAANLSRGLGLTLPYGAGGILTQFPPLYPIALALAGVIAGDLGIGARGLQALMLGGNLVVIAAFLLRIGRWAPYVGLGFIVAAPSMLLVHSMAWSEPLFIFLGYSGLFLLAQGLNESRRSFVWGAAVLLGLACVTRLMGLAFVLTGVLVILVQPALRRKALQAVAFGAIALLPLLGWLEWAAATTGSLANRTFGLHMIGRSQLQQIVGTMAGWLLLPQELPGWAKGVVLMAVGLAIAGLVWLPLRRRPAPSADSRIEARPGPPTEVRLVTILILAYVAVLAVATSLLDANVPWDDRILAPLFVACVILGAAAIDRLLTRGLARRDAPRAAWVAPMIGLLLTVWVIGIATRSANFLATAYYEGLGFRHRVWRQSQTVVRLEALPLDAAIFSNSPEAIYLATGRAARFLPRQSFPTSGRVNPSYAAEIAGLKQTLHEEGGAIVYFDAVQAHSYAGLDELVEAIGPVHVDRAADGVHLLRRLCRRASDVPITVIFRDTIGCAFWTRQSRTSRVGLTQSASRKMWCSSRHSNCVTSVAERKVGPAAGVSARSRSTWAPPVLARVRRFFAVFRLTWASTTAEDLHDRKARAERAEFAAAGQSYIASHAVRCLQIGTGANPLPGWLNTDVEPWAHGVSCVDATRSVSPAESVL